jgi:hypothetical protein
MREVADGGPRSASDPTVRMEARTVGLRRMYRPALATRDDGSVPGHRERTWGLAMLGMYLIGERAAAVAR